MITFWGLLIGTGTIWLLKLISTGLTATMFGTYEQGVVGEGEEKRVEKAVPSGPFILVDTLVCGLAGFLFGRGVNSKSVEIVSGSGYSFC